jgi:UDP-N-acetylglucosamine 2-epimerase
MFLIHEAYPLRLRNSPEAIKLCPVISYTRKNASEFETRVCVTGQPT